MKRLLSALVSALLLLAISPVHADDKVPGSIKLLPGYQHKVGRGIDSEVGIIWKDGGARIAYDIGGDAGTFTDDTSLPQRTLWRTDQVVDGHRVVVVFTKKKVLLIGFPDVDANFSSTIHNPQEMADVLLMILTYQSVDSKCAPQ